MNTISLSTLTDRLVTVFTTPDLLKEYNNNGVTEEIYGWGGLVMSPMSRPAFIKEFGTDLVAEAEAKAHAIIDERDESFKQTKYYQHLKSAEANLGHEHQVYKDAFIFALTDNMKAADGLTGYIHDCLYYNANLHQELVYVRRKFTVSPDQFLDPSLPCQLIKKFGTFGGSCTDDVDGDWDWSTLTPEQRKTIFTSAVLIICTDGRWYAYDDEGYSYDRYKYLPITWRDMFSDIIDQQQAIIDDHARQEAEAEATLKPEPTDSSSQPTDTTSSQSSPQSDQHNSDSLLITPYTSQSFLLSGNTLPVYKTIRNILHCGTWLSRKQAWCFPESKRQELCEYLTKSGIPHVISADALE